MDWARILAYVTGTVDQELLARIEYLAAENRCAGKCQAERRALRSCVLLSPICTVHPLALPRSR